MPFYVLIGHDRPDGLENRKEHRPAHFEHMAKLDAAGRLRYGGPLLNEQGEMTGSLIILKAETFEEASATYEQDPYVVHRVFEHYEVVHTKPIFPRGN